MLMNIIIILIFVIALSGAVVPLLQKIALVDLTQEEFMLMMHFVYNCLFILYISFMYLWHKDRFHQMVFKWKNLKGSKRAIFFKFWGAESVD